MINRLAVLFPLPLLAACNSVVPITTETFGPTVVFVQGGTPITSLTYDPTSSASVMISANATDPGGIRSIALTFSGATTCTEAKPPYTKLTGALGFPSGTYPLSPAPAAYSATFVVSGGTVPSEAPAVSFLQGPYICQQLQTTVKPDRPYGATITAKATATNFSGLSNSATLTIKFANRK
jgi:hypothetical protein